MIVLKTSVKAKSAQSYLEDPEISTLLHAAILFNKKIVQSIGMLLCAILAGNSEWYLF